MRLSPLAMLLAVAPFACGPRPVALDDSAGPTGAGEDTDESSGTDGTTSGDEASDADASASESESESESESDGAPQPCDVAAQDCDPTEKCAPDPDGDVGPICVPVLGVGEPGAACTLDPVDRTDDCDQSGFCWGSVCRAFCGVEPDCEPGAACWPTTSQCMPQCDPLLQDCAPGMACHWTTEYPWTCVPAVGVATHGQACARQRDCVPSHACLPAEGVPGCASASCCAQPCDASEPGGCDDQPGTECQLLFADPWCEDNNGTCMTPGFGEC